MSKPGLCSQNIDHYNTTNAKNMHLLMTLAIYPSDNSGGEAGLGAAQLPTCIDLSYVL